MQRRRFRRWRRATLSSASQTRRSAGMRPCQGSPGAGRGTTRCFAPAAGGEALLRGVTAGLTGPAARQNHHHSPLRGTLPVSCLRFLCRRARAHSLAPEPARRREGAQKVSCDACALKFDCKGHSHIATQASTLASPEQFRASHQRRGPGPEAPPFLLGSRAASSSSKEAWPGVRAGASRPRVAKAMARSRQHPGQTSAAIAQQANNGRNDVARPELCPGRVARLPVRMSPGERAAVGAFPPRAPRLSGPLSVAPVRDAAG